MSFLKWIFGRGCQHQFTWPRIGSNGDHYQICLLCGTSYQYDWRMMPDGRIGYCRSTPHTSKD